MIICGIDEVGRGCLAGPVCSAAVIFRDPKVILDVKDSKLLSASKREALDIQIRQASWIGIGLATVEEIDELNILQATFLSMHRAVEEIEKQIQKDPVVKKTLTSRVEKKDLADQIHYRIDGRDLIPDFGVRKQKAIIGGDRLVREISAASIVAKVFRDRLMIDLDRQYPEYKFCKHKGYGTAVHVQAISEFGILAEHRKSFAPIRHWQNRN